MTNVYDPCTVKSAGGRVCIRSAGHAGAHEDAPGWAWASAGGHAQHALYDEDQGGGATDQ